MGLYGTSYISEFAHTLNRSHTVITMPRSASFQLPLPAEIFHYHIAPKLDLVTIVRARASCSQLKEAFLPPSPGLLRKQVVNLFQRRLVDYCQSRHDANYITHRLWCVLPVPLRPRWLYTVDWDQYDSMSVIVPVPDNHLMYPFKDESMKSFDGVLEVLGSREFQYWIERSIDIEVSFSDAVSIEEQQKFVQGMQQVISLVESSSHETFAMNREYRWESNLKQYLDP